MLNWEEIKQNQTGCLFRVKVPNGWLVKEVHEVHLDLKWEGNNVLNNAGYEWTSSITFVPDPEHRWDINNPIVDIKINTTESILCELVKKIPESLLRNYYLTTNGKGEESNELRKYILNNFNGSEIHLLLNDFNLITLNINNK